MGTVKTKSRKSSQKNKYFKENTRGHTKQIKEIILNLNRFGIISSEDAPASSKMTSSLFKDLLNYSPETSIFFDTAIECLSAPSNIPESDDDKKESLFVKDWRETITYSFFAPRRIRNEVFCIQRFKHYLKKFDDVNFFLSILFFKDTGYIKFSPNLWMISRKWDQRNREEAIMEDELSLNSKIVPKLNLLGKIIFIPTKVKAYKKIISHLPLDKAIYKYIKYEGEEETEGFKRFQFHFEIDKFSKFLSKQTKENTTYATRDIYNAQIKALKENRESIEFFEMVRLGKVIIGKVEYYMYSVSE